MAGQIPQSFINDLLGRVDIVGVVGERVPLKKAGKDFQARCPFHDEKTPSFTVSQDKQFYYCFGCSASGTALTFLMEYERLPFVEAVETLAAQAGVEVPRERSRRPQRDNSGLYETMQRAERYFRGQLKRSKQAVDYLKLRGLTGTVARDFGVGYAPDSWDGLQKALGSGGDGDKLLLEAGLVSKNERGNVYDRFRDGSCSRSGTSAAASSASAADCSGTGTGRNTSTPRRRRSSTRAKSSTGCSRHANPYET